MRAFDKLLLRLRSLFHRRALDAQLDAELQFHLDQLTDEYTASGMSPEDARRAALRDVGNVPHYEDQCRDHRRTGLFDDLARDIRYAVRTLAKTPVFTGVVVATLALGIGGVTAVFSLVHGVLLAPSPYEAPGQLVRIYQQAGNDPSSRYFLSGAHFRELRDRASTFEGLAALFTYAETGLDLVHDGHAQRLRVLQVTSDYFDVLRAGPMRGRGFERQDETGAPRVILSDALWRTRFHADPAAIGRTVHLNAEPYLIAGVAPPGFQDPIAGEFDAWTPYDLAGNTDPQNYSMTAVGRLRNGVALAQASAELASLSRALAERWPQARLNALVAHPLDDDVVARSRGTLSALSIAVGLVLLVACLNVANLFLVRAAGRAREFAIRSALGSGGIRIARQLLVESVLLAIAGGAAGLGLAVFAIRALRSIGAEAIPRLAEVGLDPVVLAATAVVSLATGVVFGILPAARFSRVDPSQALQQQSRSATGGRAQGRLRNALAVMQVAFALMLLVGAGILTLSFYRLRQIPLGFRVDGVLTFDVTLPPARYGAAQRARLQEEIARRIETISGVTAAGGVSRLPATGSYHPWRGRTPQGPEGGVRAQNRVVSGNYFAALGIPVLAGRVFDARDDASAPDRAVVSASFARQAFPGVRFEDVIGRRIAVLAFERQIIGVVGDVTLDAYGAPAPAIYHAHRQFAENRAWALTHVVAGAAPADRILNAVRQQIAAIDPQLVIYRVAPMADVIGRGVSRERFALVLMGAFAVVAVGLAAIGLYGVLAYSVRQRRHEFGIRVALGATAAQVRRLVLRQAAIVLAAGLGAGALGALAVGRWLAALVFQTSPRDPYVFGATALLLAAVALVSAWLPAWRASRVEPGVAMHDE